jgi:hypothetical protein
MRNRILLACALALGGCVDFHVTPADDAGSQLEDAGELLSDAGEPDSGHDGGSDAGEPAYDAGSDGGGSDAGVDAERDAGFDPYWPWPGQLCAYQHERAAVYGCPPIECPTSGICDQTQARRCFYLLEISTYDCPGLARLWAESCAPAFCG